MQLFVLPKEGEVYFVWQALRLVCPVDRELNVGNNVFYLLKRKEGRKSDIRRVYNHNLNETVFIDILGVSENPPFEFPRRLWIPELGSEVAIFADVSRCSHELASGMHGFGPVYYSSSAIDLISSIYRVFPRLINH